MYCCSQEKETCALLFLGEDNMTYTTVIREEHWCFTVSGEGNWCSTVSGEGIWCSTVLGRRATGCIYRFYRFYLYKTSIFICNLDIRFHTNNG